MLVCNEVFQKKNRGKGGGGGVEYMEFPGVSKKWCVKWCDVEIPGVN